MKDHPTTEQIREALKAINAKLQEVEAEAETALRSSPSEAKGKAAVGVMEARVMVRELLKSITPTETLGDQLQQALKDARTPTGSEQD